MVDTDDNFKKASDLDQNPTPAKKKSAAALKEEDPKLIAEWERQIELYGDKMPKKYIKFTVKYRCFWACMNIFNILSSAGMCVGSVMILGAEKES